MTQLHIALTSDDEFRLAQLQEALGLPGPEEVVRWAIRVACEVARTALTINAQRSHSQVIVVQNRDAWDTSARVPVVPPGPAPMMPPGKGSLHPIILPLSPDEPDVGGDIDPRKLGFVDIDPDTLGFRIP